MTPTENESPVAKPTFSGELMLFATKTCPNCKQAEKLLNEAGINFTKIFAEDNPALATDLGIRQAPTLVSGENKISGLGAIRRFISES